MTTTQPKNGYVSSGALRLHFLDWGGEGAPLLFLHGSCAHAHWWDFVAPLFREKFRAYALDLRGHGDSDWSPEGAYGIEDYVADVGRVIEELHLDRPVLVGHSLGSFVALGFAIDHPRALEALVLIDARASFAASGSRYMKLLQMFAPAEHPTLEEAVSRFTPLPKETSAEADVLAHVARHSHRQSDSGRWVTKFDRRSLGSHLPFDFRGHLAELEFPVLFVRGEKSRVLSAEAAATLARSCRRGRWVEIPGAHHHVLLDRPQPLARQIIEFLG